MHTVESGETLALIAKRFNAAPKAIVAANGIEDSEPALGAKLIIPGAYKEAVVAKAQPRKVSATSKNTVARRTPAKPASKALSKAPTTATAKKPQAPKSVGTLARK